MIDDTIKDFDPAHVRQFLKRDLDGVVIATLSERMKAVRPFAPHSRPPGPFIIPTCALSTSTPCSNTRRTSSTTRTCTSSSTTARV